MKKFNLISLSVATVLALVGCGGGGSTNPETSPAPKTGTGYYIDAAVGGLSYVCGSQKGTTDPDGKFTFEVGETCTFKVGDIELPEVKADELKDGAKFIEDDPKTTQFLQSLDDAKDGKITITPELIKALKEKDVVIVPDDAGLKALVKSMEALAKNDETFTFTGYYVTADEAREHVEGTKGEVAAEGVAFTFPSKYYADVELDSDYYDGHEHKQFEAEIFEFTADKKFNHSEIVFNDGAFVLDTHDNDDDTDYVLENGKWVEDKDNQFTTVVSENDTLVTLSDKYQLSMKSIKDLEGKSRTIHDSELSVTMPKDAKEIQIGFKVLKEEYYISEQARTHGNTENQYYISLSDVVKNQCDSRYFSHAKEESGVEGIAFSCGQESQTSGTLVGVKNDNSLVTTGVGTWEIKTLPNSDIEVLLVTIDEKYNKHSDSPIFAMKDGEVWRGEYDSIGEKEPGTAYNQVAFDAFTAKIKGVAGSIDSSKSLSDYIVGKTYYATVDDSYTDENGNTINNDHVETLSFNADGQTLNITWVENEETKTHNVSYSINNDKLTISGVDGNGESFSDTFNAPVTETNDYITFSGHDGRFFTTYAAAQASLSDNSSTENPTTNKAITEDMLSGKTFYFDYDENDDGYGYVKIIVTSTGNVTIHELEYNRDGSVKLDETTKGTYTLPNGELHMLDKKGKSHNYKLLEYSNTLWKLQSLKDATHQSIWYLNKPSNYPSEL